MRRRSAALLVLALLLATAGCASAPTEEMWQSIEIGMTGEQVKAVLGEPEEIRYHAGRDIWFYESADGNYRGISFGADGTVVGR